MQRVIRYCEQCGAEIFHGEKVSYVNAWGEEEDDGEAGNFIEGAGVCEVCGKELCGECADWKDGECKECQSDNNRN